MPFTTRLDPSACAVQSIGTVPPSFPPDISNGGIPTEPFSVAGAPPKLPCIGNVHRLIRLGRGDIEFFDLQSCRHAAQVRCPDMQRDVGNRRQRRTGIGDLRRKRDVMQRRQHAMRHERLQRGEVRHAGGDLHRIAVQLLRLGNAASQRELRSGSRNVEPDRPGRRGPRTLQLRQRTDIAGQCERVAIVRGGHREMHVLGG